MHALKVGQMVELCRCVDTPVLSSELLFEFARVQIVLADIVVDLPEELVQAVVLVLDSGQPAHCKISLEIGLSQRGVLLQLQESSSLLPSKHVGLSFHQGVPLGLVLLLLQEAPKG